MDKKAVIEKVIRASQTQAADPFSPTFGPAWMFRSSTLQQELNEAIEAWLRRNDPEPLTGVVMVMQATSALSDKEADELLEALEKEE